MTAPNSFDVEKFLEKIKPLDDFYEVYRNRMVVIASTIIGFSSAIIDFLIKIEDKFNSFEGCSKYFFLIFGPGFLFVAILLVFGVHFCIAKGYKIYATHKLQLYKLAPGIEIMKEENETVQQLESSGKILFSKSNDWFGPADIISNTAGITFIIGFIITIIGTFKVLYF